MWTYLILTKKPQEVGIKSDLIQQIWGDDQDFAFPAISSQVMLMLPIKTKDHILSSTDRSLGIHPFLEEKAEWTGKDEGE